MSRPLPGQAPGDDVGLGDRVTWLGATYQVAAFKNDTGVVVLLPEASGAPVEALYRAMLSSQDFQVLAADDTSAEPSVLPALGTMQGTLSRKQRRKLLRLHEDMMEIDTGVRRPGQKPSLVWLEGYQALIRWRAENEITGVYAVPYDVEVEVGVTKASPSGGGCTSSARRCGRVSWRTGARSS